MQLLQTCSLTFLDYFDQKIKSIVEKMGRVVIQSPMSMPTPLNTLYSFRHVNVEEVRTIVNTANVTYCDSDPLPISDAFWCENFCNILNIFTAIINCSLINNSFPDSEKLAVIKPIIKSIKDIQCLSSYRPVSNLTFLPKIIESVLLTQLLGHLQAVQALPNSQSAYRKLYSTETALCSEMNDLIILMDERINGLLILLDLSAAFDTVVHELLLMDCKSVGIDGDSLTYLRSYLENRQYCLQIGRSFSDKKTLNRGVPQGRMLEPVLFCIYTIELSYKSKKHKVGFKVFADDTQLYMAVDNIDNTEGKIKLIMDDVGKWMESKQL